MELELYETRHPNQSSEQSFNNLIGIDAQKSALLENLYFFFNDELVSDWHQKHHNSNLNFFNQVISGTPLFMLSGDVGCGKTALANTVATPLGKMLNKRVVCMETPSDIRGSGRVGEISNRITAAFTKAKSKVSGNDIGILIIDEADDIATDREQNQAHHEDRSGLNVLIKQLDAIQKEKIKLAVILITNRVKALDPAVIRRATQVIKFDRPDKQRRKAVFSHVFGGSKISNKELENLVEITERSDRLYSFSDLIQKAGKQSFIKAIERDKPFTPALYIEVLTTIEPSPLIN